MERRCGPRSSMTLGASWLSPHCPKCNSERGFPTQLATRSNEIGDVLCECMACGYVAVFRVGTDQFEPPKGQPSETWQPPLVYRLPTIELVRPEAPHRPTASARPTPTGIDSREHRGRHKPPAAAGAAPQSRTTNSPKTAQGAKPELANAGSAEPLTTETARGPNSDASLDAPANFRKSRRTPAPNQPRSPGRRTRRHRQAG